MADDDTKPGGEGQPTGGERGPGKRGERPDRGERGGGGRGGGGAGVSVDAIKAALEQLAYQNPDAFRALVGGAAASAASRGPDTPKLSTVLAGVPVENIDDVIGTLEQAIEDFEEARHDRRIPSAEEVGQMLSRIGSVAPGLPAMLQENSRYRNKPLEHSIRAAKGWLEHRHGPGAVAERKGVR